MFHKHCQAGSIPVPAIAFQSCSPQVPFIAWPVSAGLFNWDEIMGELVPQKSKVREFKVPDGWRECECFVELLVLTDKVNVFLEASKLMDEAGIRYSGYGEVGCDYMRYRATGFKGVRFFTKE